ncbi:MAG: hypothetical protein GX202_01440 [Firmicutes bacterium]|nr:hypothetical protein [Bacillota bacterium]
MWKYLLFFLGLCLFCAPVQGQVEPGAARPAEVYFEAVDPAGDDYGPGSYIYPRNLAFRPYEGLYDLLWFRVAGDGQQLFFDLRIKEVTNPWNAPEGFIHPVIHIYLDTRPGGRTAPLSEALGVKLAPQYGWEFALVGVGWESSRLVYLSGNQTLVETDLTAIYLPDQKIIRLMAPVAVVGQPQKSWRYYVLVGAYDGFGPGFLREIRSEPGDWHFGGAAHAAAPRILDLLAPERGKYAQERQLQPGKEGMPVIYPVNRKKGIPWGYLGAAGLVLVLGGVLKRRPVITGFWLKGTALDDNNKPGKNEK